MKQAVIFGAGNIGRGFIGQLFSESGYEVTFVDIDRPLLAALNAAKAYTIELVEDERREQVRVAPVRALHSEDREGVVRAVAGAAIMATAVGARVLPVIAPAIAAGIARRQRAGSDAPLNCIVCENLKDAARTLHDLVAAHLDEAGRCYMADHVGFVDTVIGRMVPPLTEEMRRTDPALIRVEPYKELPVDRSGFCGPVPQIEAMQPSAPFGVYTARKLYVHNCGHAVLAYHGYLKGYTYGYEALADPEIDARLWAAWDESIAGLAARYDAGVEWLRAHARDLHRRFANRALGDTIYRLGRDPIRKLAPSDRLVAPARLAEAAGQVSCALAGAIAAALHFDPPEDAIAADLQARLSARGLDAVLAEVCQIQPHEPLAALIRDQF